MIKELLDSGFGLDAKTEEITIKGLPLYMKTGRSFYLVTVDTYTFLVVEVSSTDSFGVIALQKQAAIYREKVNMEVAYLFSDLSKPQRDSLIKHRQAFIWKSGQLYLPFIGMIFQNSFSNKEKVSTKRMMPATQLLFLYMLYTDLEYVIKKDAAEKLRLTKTSITRASAQLKAMDLITEETFGREIRMTSVSKGKELYAKAKPFLINPVQSRIQIAAKDNTKKLLVAGESALSMKSMLAAPKHEVFAVYKGDQLVNSLNRINKQWEGENGYTEIELWKYDPTLITSQTSVDVVSLTMSLSDNEDERVQGELEDLLEDYSW